MQQVGPGPDVGWRADKPPTPRPILKAPTGAPRRRRLGLGVLGVSAFLILGNPELQTTALTQIERAAELAGLGLQQIALAGHRFTADTDIYNALDLDGARTLLGFDARAAQARLERLPWIDHASIERVVPYGIDVRVTERVPFALWRSGERSWLIDRDGRKLQRAPADVMPHLLRVSGDGAPKEAAALSVLLADVPEIARKVDSAERVGARRWTLHLAGGMAVDLPAAGEAEALARLVGLREAGLGGAKHIDLRMPSRILVRDPTGTGTAEGGPAVPAGRIAATRS